MPAFNKWIGALAAVLIAVATALGAWASHGLEGALASDALRSVQTGIDYQFFHALGLLVLALATARTGASMTLRAAMAGIALGTVLFCGGVYVSGFSGPPAFVSLAPVGGTLLILAWLVAAVALLGAENHGRI